MFTKNSKASRDTIKKKILKDQLLDYKCQECNITTTYNNKSITLHLDHINGIRDDHRLENLRFLCPNCHSQTDTYCGKSKNKRANKLCKCGKEKWYYSVRCRTCSDNSKLGKKAKINWPPLDELLKELEETSYSSMSRRLGVSDNAIRQHIMKRK